MIRVQTDDFYLQDEYEALRKTGETGAIVTFIGTVRDFTNGNSTNNTFFLQHYPGMTEKVLTDIEQRARERWPLQYSCIIHRVGELSVNDQIVFVGVSSAHREAAFAACHFMIDVLKTQAPFWKKEGEQWVQANEADQHKADQWLM